MSFHTRCLLFILLAFLLVLPAVGAPGYAQPNSRTFPETGKSVTGRFLEYWTTHGGLAQQGYPITDQFFEKNLEDGKTYSVQYFERAVFELHPENQPPYDMLLSRLGSSLYAEKYPHGAHDQQPNVSPGSVFFVETGQRLGGLFLDYWRIHGGLAQQGYPISDEFAEQSEIDGKAYRVQYFERAVFELHPENRGTDYEVLLAQLGSLRYKQRYNSQPISTPTAISSIPITSRVGVDIMDYTFSPAVITVTVGAEVTWTQRDGAPHNTVSKDYPRLWQSPVLSPGATFRYVFDRPGIYDYYCTLHPEMTGRIVVTP